MQELPEKADLDRLGERIQTAKDENRGDMSPKDVQQENAPMPISRIGFDFLATIMGSAILGWLVDKGFGSKPWGMIAILILGFVAGIVGVWRSMNAGDAVVADKNASKKGN